MFDDKPQEEKLTQEEFMKRFKDILESSLESFRNDWPGDLLACGMDEWIDRYQKHCEDSGIFIKLN